MLNLEISQQWSLRYESLKWFMNPSIILIVQLLKIIFLLFHFTCSNKDISKLWHGLQVMQASTPFQYALAQFCDSLCWWSMWAMHMIGTQALSSMYNAFLRLTSTSLSLSILN